MKILLNGSLIELGKKRDLEVVKSMYPVQDITNKYILFVICDFYFCSSYKVLEGEIKFIYDEQEEAFQDIKQSIRKPYLNKGIYQVSMQHNEKLSNLGIPILFDTFEELKKLKAIEVTWKVEYDALGFNQQEIIETISVVNIRCDLRYEKSEKEKIYTVRCKDYIAHEMDEVIAYEYFQEFDNIMFIRNENKGEDDYFMTNILKGEVKNHDSNEFMKYIMQQFGMETILGNLTSYKNMNMYCMSKKEVLQPYPMCDSLHFFNIGHTAFS